MRTEEVVFRNPFQYRRTCGPGAWIRCFIEQLVFFFFHACTQFFFDRSLTTLLAAAPS
jgi:hypothetical protein